jgi:hypothetical protein
MIILFIQLLTTCTCEGNKTDHQPMIYDPPHKTSALNAEPFKCSAFISVCCQLYCTYTCILQNLLGGALFGVWKSFPLVCVLSATGASCCFLLSKFFGKHHIERFFPEKVKFLQGKV